MSRVYRRASFSKLEIIFGWYYEYKNEVSGPYDTQQHAESALMVRIIDAKPQRGRSDPTTAKP